MKSQLRNYLTPLLLYDDMGEKMMPPSSTPGYLWYAGELTPALTEERENEPCPAPAAAHRRAGPAPHLGSTRELTLLVAGEPVPRV